MSSRDRKAAKKWRQRRQLREQYKKILQLKSMLSTAHQAIAVLTQTNREAHVMLAKLRRMLEEKS